MAAYYVDAGLDAGLVQLNAVPVQFWARVSGKF